MKQIMMSVRPKWVAKILSGEKTLEIRNTAPKEWMDYIYGKTKKKPEPMIVNIYCTKEEPFVQVVFEQNYDERTPHCIEWRKEKGYHKYFPYGDYAKYSCAVCKADLMDMAHNGKVVAKFTLSEVEKIECDGNWEDPYFYTKTKEQEELLESACIDDLEPYMRGCEGYGWHISDLEIFDEPKKLSEFSVTKKYKSCDECPHYEYDGLWHCLTCEERVPLIRAPQSWCYVEERE